jgi:hypothetical protein
MSHTFDTFAGRPTAQVLRISDKPSSNNILMRQSVSDWGRRDQKMISPSPIKPKNDLSVPNQTTIKPTETNLPIQAIASNTLERLISVQRLNAIKMFKLEQE